MISTAATQRSLTVGRLAALAEVSANAVRFYERQGLIPVPVKNDSGYRLYGPEAIEQLRFIKQAQRAGFTLSEIDALIRLKEDASSCCSQVRERVVEKKRELDSRIEAMRDMARSLDQLIADCRDGSRPTDDCPILASLSHGGAPQRR
jgi:DNA-binding transcriptional MerR regulator